MSVLFKFLVQSSSFSIFKNERIENLIRIGRLCSINEWSHQSYLETKKNYINPMLKSFDFQQSNKTEAIIPVEEKYSMPSELKVENFEHINKTFENESSEFETILKIRKQFGIDIDLDESTKLVTDHVKSVLGRSLESLSGELYNKDMHFVLELIQNADDNEYYNKDSTVQPSLIFLIQNDKITLFNNETGFKERNIKAICDVKASTKGKHQQGYIGRKGIGFKSVFTVTDQPEIHSNGYHIQFDIKNNGHIGYILPNWIHNKQIDSLIQFINERVQSLN